MSVAVCLSFCISQFVRYCTDYVLQLVEDANTVGSATIKVIIIQTYFNINSRCKGYVSEDLSIIMDHPIKLHHYDQENIEISKGMSVSQKIRQDCFEYVITFWFVSFLEAEPFIGFRVSEANELEFFIKEGQTTSENLSLPISFQLRVYDSNNDFFTEANITLYNSTSNILKKNNKSEIVDYRIINYICVGGAVLFVIVMAGIIVYTKYCKKQTSCNDPIPRSCNPPAQSEEIVCENLLISDNDDNSSPASKI